MTIPLFGPKTRIVTPLTLFGTDLVSWHRADLGVTIDGSNRVSDWADQSGNGRHLTQTVAGSRPDYLATGGSNGGPIIDSGTYGTAYLQYTAVAGLLSTAAVGWSSFAILSALATGASRNFTATTTLTGTTTQFSWQNEGIGNARMVMLNTSVPTAIAVENPDFIPVIKYLAVSGSLAGDGTRTMVVAGDGSSTTVSDGPHTRYIIYLADGYVCSRWSASFYQNLSVQELIWVNRAATATDLASWAAYAKTRGVTF